MILKQLPDSFDPTQLVYKKNRSPEDAISHLLHATNSHLNVGKGNYVRWLCVDYSAAFNTIVPQRLIGKIRDLEITPSLLPWYLNFLTDRPQRVRWGNNNFTDPRILNIGASQGCGLSPLFYTLYIHDCVATHPSTIIGKFADDTVVVGLISKNDETAYREEVEHLTSWCTENNLLLNVTKTKEMVMDFRQSTRTPHLPITINVPGSTHQLGPDLECTSLCSGEEDDRETVPSQEAEEAHQIPSPTESLLLCHSGVSADQQYNSLVWQLQHH